VWQDIQLQEDLVDYGNKIWWWWCKVVATIYEPIPELKLDAAKDVRRFDIAPIFNDCVQVIAHSTLKENPHRFIGET
jgi:hypothetical protein